MSRSVMVLGFLFLLLLPSSSPAYSQPTPEGHQLSLDGFDMYYETLGEGEPLLLVHGWSGNTTYFGPLLEPLAQRYHLIIPDLRGHGRSTNPGGTFTMGQAAEDLFALLNHLGVDRTRAIGASAGGIILLHMSTGQPFGLSQGVSTCRS